MPTKMTITGRTSTMTHAFITSIIPQVEPTEEQISESLRILEIDPENTRCAYCGDPSTQWDHLRPLVKDKLPTGYITEIHNLVPACGQCNQSKGNNYWGAWITSDAPLSPKSRNVKNLDKYIERLKAYEKWGNVKPINFEEVVGPTLWNQHWDNREKLFEMMRKTQVTANEIKNVLGKSKP